MEIIKNLGRLFYLIDPRDTYEEHVTEDLNSTYMRQALPYLFTLVILEYFVQAYLGKRRTRLNDGIISLSNGMYLALSDIVFRGVESYVYIKVYENYRIYELPWDSPWTWYFAAIAVDFGYYWFHRAAHEINLFWTQHQVHHSSEDFNLTTAMRQGAFQNMISWIFYIPLAFFVPTPVFLIHQQFNLLFQFWIHAEVVGSLGPLEWVLNTPKHHKIHHGSNRYCLDKNYAGVLIIWDRMFGTFEEERPDEKLVYGLVEDVKSFNPFWLQTFYLTKIWQRVKEYDNWWDKLGAVFKGPGWTPGKGRLGDINDCPVYPEREIYDVKIPTWKNVYAVIHFLFVLMLLHLITAPEFKDMLSQAVVMAIIGFMLFSLTSIGFILEDREIGRKTEIFRSAFVVLVLIYFRPVNIAGSLRQATLILYGISAAIWALQTLQGKEKVVKKKQK